MGFHVDRRRMIAEHQNAVFSPFTDARQNRSDNFFVEKLDGQNLPFCVAFMAHLVGRFQVKKHKIHELQRVERHRGLPFVVGIDVPGGALHAQRFQTGVNAQSVEQVHRGNHAAPESVFLSQRRHLRLSPLPPQPDGIGRFLPIRDAGGVDRMVFEDVRGGAHQSENFLRAIALRQKRDNGLAGDVVRRSGLRRPGRIAPHQQMTIPDAGIKLIPGRVQLFVEVQDDFPRLGRRNVPGREVVHERRPLLGLSDMDQVAAVGDVALPQRNALACGLQRSAARVGFFRVVAQHA